MNRIAFAFLLLVPAAALAEQHFHVGVKGGIPLTDAFSAATSGNASYFTNPHRYTLGPMFDIRLPLGLGIEFNALYKSLEYRFQGTDANNNSIQATTTGSSWEFPLVGKYRMGVGPLKPYAGAGVSFQKLADFTQVGNAILGGSLSDPSEQKSGSNTGMVLEGGLEVKVPFVRLFMELRYTRWVNETFKDAVRNPAGSLLRNGRNQADFLLGLTF